MCALRFVIARERTALQGIAAVALLPRNDGGAEGIPTARQSRTFE